MFCLKWCSKGFLIICDRVAANLKYFRTFVFYKVASVGEIQLYQTSHIGGYFPVALFTKSLDPRPQIL